MKTVCSWCKKVIKDDPNIPNGPISHGVCPSCAEKLFSEMGTPLERFLDQWQDPIVILDANGQVQGGNQVARSLPGFKPLSAGPLLPGEVFECPWADLPEGCGKTVHCVGCAIRRAINTTQKTGQPTCRVPGHLDCRVGDKPVAIWISTEKIGNHIYLVIEKSSST